MPLTNLWVFVADEVNGGDIRDRKLFAEGDGPPPVSSGKPMRWIPDNPPAYNSRYQRLQVTIPIPQTAAEVPYTIISKALGDFRDQRLERLREIGVDRHFDYILAGDLPLFVTEFNAHKTALQNATDVTEVEAIDIRAGWTH